MKRLLIALLLLCGVAKNTPATDVVLGTFNDLSWAGSGTDWYAVWSAASIPNMVLYYPYDTNADPTPDGSGQSNDGYQGGVTWVAETNGLSAHVTWTTSSVTTSDVSEVKGMYSWWANTNGVWRYYETMNGTNFTDLAADTWVATNFYSVSGDVITWGGLACAGDFDEIRTYTNAIMSTLDRTNTNIWQAATLGILSQYLSDNTNYYDACVLHQTHNNQLQDGSKSHTNFVTASSPTAGGTTSNGWYSYDGAANYQQLATVIPQIDNASNLTVWAWVRPHATSRGDILAIWNNGVDEKFDLLQGVSAGTFNFYVSSVAGIKNTGVSGTFGTNQWYLLHGVIDGHMIYLYTNSVLASSADMGAPVTNNSDGVLFYVGKNATAGEEWDGDMSAWGVQTNAWAATVITNQFDAMKADYGL